VSYVPVNVEIREEMCNPSRTVSVNFISFISYV